MTGNEKQEKGLVFVTGHKRPAVAPLGARYVRRHADGTPVRATSTGDTLEAALARYAAAAAVGMAAETAIFPEREPEPAFETRDELRAVRPTGTARGRRRK